ncbi:MAG: phage major capsid protein [Pirellulaceae bacterium]
MESIKPSGLRAWLTRQRSPEVDRLGIGNESSLRLFPESRATQLVGTDNVGGFLVPDHAMANWPRSREHYCQIGNGNFGTVHETDDGRDLPIPITKDATSGNQHTGEWVDEDTAPSEQAVSFGSTTLKAYKASSKRVLASLELVQDSASWEANIFGILGERIGRTMAAGFVAGNGTGQPTGLLTGAVDSGVTTASNTAVALGELLDLAFSVDEAYRLRPSCAWVVSDTAHKWIITATSTLNGVYYPAFHFADGLPRLLGHPILVSPGMPSTAGSKAIAFGDLSHYHIRRLSELYVVRLRERYIVQVLSDSLLSNDAMASCWIPAMVASSI